jgi:ribonuclease P protein component
VSKLLKKFLFLKENRLLTPGDYCRVFSGGKRHHGLYLTIVVRVNYRGRPRLGLRISKKCAKRAVDRNRVKRVIRQSFRLNQDRLNDLDIVVLAKNGAASLSNLELQNCLDALWASI